MSELIHRVPGTLPSTSPVMLGFTGRGCISQSCHNGMFTTGCTKIVRPFPVTLIKASIKSNAVKNALTLPVISKLAKMLGRGTKRPFSGIQISWFEVTIYRKELEVKA